METVAGHFATRLALIAFSTVALCGVLDNTDFRGCLQTALLTAIVFCGIGYLVGEIARLVVEEATTAEVERMMGEADAAMEHSRQAA